MRVGLFGVALMSNNYGCTALGITQLQFIENIAKKNNVSIEYYLFANESIDRINKLKEILDIKSDIQVKKVINIRDGLKGMNFIKKEIEKCDIIFDLTYGDSFSDIYGIKKFFLFSLPKLMTIKKNKKLVIGPQTIGPYKNIFVKMMAKKILKKSEILCVRDEKSLEVAKKLTNRDDIILTSDLAMELPYEKKIFESEKFKIGINISDLLWSNSNEENLKKFGIVVDYKELIKAIISKFDRDNYEVHLVTHVYAKDDLHGEYALAKEINKLYPNTILAPKFENPIEAKSYMSGLDLFFGARMHATIGAFSSGVPVIPTSYSRKFEGLYGTLGYNYGINLRDTTIEQALIHIDDTLSNYEEMKKNRECSYKNALKRNEKYHKLLENIIK